jgi:hypothetical protein
VSGRVSRRFAWGLVAITLVLLVSANALSLAGEAGIDGGQDAFIWAFALVFALAGVLIACREPGNAIGWIFLGAAAAAGLGSLVGAYADYWVHSGEGSEGLAKTAASYSNVSWMPFILVPATFLVLLFPDGHLLSRRWRFVAWCAGLGIAANVVLEGLRPGPIEDYPQIRNPYGVESSALDAVQAIAVLGLLIGIAGSALSLALRFRRARGEQRQQMKWLALAGAVVAVTVPVGTAVYDVVGEAAANLAIMLSVLGLPAATGVAILRYRLFDIDVVINRTLVYAALTATLAGAYLGTVLLLQLLLSPLTEQSNVAIAGSTLAVAALFRPARRRIQELVDRRFFRSKYDAARTLESFGTKLRDEVDLDALGGELRRVVADTMQPGHVSLWLRAPGAQR